MDGYVVSPVAPFATAASATINTVAVRTDITPLPAPIILPYQLRVGTKLKFEAEGEWSSTGTPTFVMGFYLGTSVGTNGVPGAFSVILAESSAITVSTGAAWPWRMEYRCTVLGVGSAGSVLGQGDIEAGTSLTAFTSTAIPTTQALRTVSSVPTNGPLVCGVCATPSVSSASNTAKTNNFTVLILN